MATFQFNDAPMTDLQLMNIGTNDAGTGFGETDSPEVAAAWLIEQMDDEAMRQSGHHLHPFDLWLYTHSVFEVREEHHEALAPSINRGVSLFRSRVLRLNDLAWLSGLVRAGLFVPWSIEYRYETIYAAELPWTISPIMQNAFMGNPLNNERRAWKTPRARNPVAAPF